MTPVISPWVFYIMPVCNKIAIATWLFFGFLLIYALGFGIAWISENDCFYPDKNKMKLYASKAKKIVILAILVAVLASLIPSEATITKMIVTQNVTVERVEAATDVVTTVYNDIMNLFGATNG